MWNVHGGAWRQAGATVLHYAAQTANSTLLKILLRHKADINATDNVGPSTLVTCYVMRLTSCVTKPSNKMLQEQLVVCCEAPWDHWPLFIVILDKVDFCD